MEINSIRKRAMEFKEQFFFGDLGEIVKYYETDDGIFVVGEDNGNKEVFWAVNEIEDLRKGLDVIKKDYNHFLFRYGKNYDELLKEIDRITSWGYYYKNMHVGYLLDFNHFKNDVNNDFETYCLKSNEIDELMVLDKEIFDLFNASITEFNEWVEDNNHLILTIKDKGKLIGFIIIHDIKTNQCFIRNIGIAKEYQGMKLGQQLLKKALLQAKNEGCKKCFLWVSRENHSAIHLYEKVGFVIDKNEAEAVFKSDDSENK
ncbi:GNAT family N-acetyltransferase [Mycoplasmatota bacterium]|nr:GNAT family N-acetyltransferase [Mycoplasmatota bacterium]